MLSYPLVFRSSLLTAAEMLSAHRGTALYSTELYNVLYLHCRGSELLKHREWDSRCKEQVRIALQSPRSGCLERQGLDNARRDCATPRGSLCGRARGRSLNGHD